VKGLVSNVGIPESGFTSGTGKFWADMLFEFNIIANVKTNATNA
jgi:hypothetical protein